MPNLLARKGFWYILGTPRAFQSLTVVYEADLLNWLSVVSLRAVQMNIDGTTSLSVILKEQTWQQIAHKQHKWC